MAGEVLGWRWALRLSFVIPSVVPQRFQAVVLAAQVPPCAQTERVSTNLWRAPASQPPLFPLKGLQGLTTDGSM